MNTFKFYSVYCWVLFIITSMYSSITLWNKHCRTNEDGKWEGIKETALVIKYLTEGQRNLLEVGWQFNSELPNSQDKERNIIIFIIHGVHWWKQTCFLDHKLILQKFLLNAFVKINTAPLWTWVMFFKSRVEFGRVAFHNAPQWWSESVCSSPQHLTRALLVRLHVTVGASLPHTLTPVLSHDGPVTWSWLPPRRGQSCDSKPDVSTPVHLAPPAPECPCAAVWESEKKRALSSLWSYLVGQREADEKWSNREQLN